MPKRTTILFPILFLLTHLANAQITFGVKAGPDFPKMLDARQGFDGSGNTVTENSKATTHIYAGIFMDVPLGKLFTFRPGLGYLGAGGSLSQVLDFDSNLLAPSLKYRLDYVNLPLQLLFTPAVPFGRLFVGGGLYGGVLVKAKTTSPYGAYNQSLQIGSGPGDQVKRFDFGLSATAGLILKDGVLISVDFQQGLVPISVPSGLYASNLNTRNVVWGVSVGYQFAKKKK